MRERTTWNRDQIVKLANSLKKAEDPRAMNQDHLKQQPAADKYEIGGPSEFGEDVHPSAGTWKAEYSGGEVKRNEIGLPELRSDTFNHSEKTAAQDEDEDDDFLEKKADVCLSIAKRMLPKTASDQMIEDQAFAFMHLADADIIATHARLASQDDEDKKDEDKGQQDKEAGQIPENFKKDEDKKDDDKGQQSKEAGQIPENFKKKDEGDDKKDDDKGQQSKEAQGQQQKQDDDKKQSQQGQQDQDDDKKQASDKIAALRKQACDALMSGDQQGAQQAVQQIAQLQQGQQQQQLSQEQAQQQVQQMLSQALQQQGQPQQSDDQMLDQMLQQQMSASTDTSMLTATTGPMMDIQLEGPSMDMTEIRLGSEDEALTALFASHDEVQQAAHAQSLQTGIPVQASMGMSRTASTRTVGTRPTGGVAQLGGASAPSSGGGEIDKLSGLWASAPNVKSVFDT